MLRGLLSAAAAAGRPLHDNETAPELVKVAELLERHELDCKCEVCMAYVSAETPAAGMLAAMVALDKEKNDNGNLQGRS